MKLVSLQFDDSLGTMEPMFAVVEIAGKQYSVVPDGTIVVDKVEGAVDAQLSFDHVLLVSDGTSTHVGTPYVKGAKVVATVLEQGKGEKVEIRRYKQKVRYRRHIGFRPYYTKLMIASVSA